MNKEREPLNAQEEIGDGERGHTESRAVGYLLTADGPRIDAVGTNAASPCSAYTIGTSCTVACEEKAIEPRLLSLPRHPYNTQFLLPPLHGVME